MEIEKGIPIPSKSHSRVNCMFRKTLSKMDEGDSVLFPWDVDVNGQPIIYEASKIKKNTQANNFQAFLKKSRCESVSRSFEEGKRVWLVKKGESNE